MTEPFTRSKKRSAPHNLYGDVPEFRAEGERQGMPTTMSITGLAFDRRASVETTPVDHGDHDPVLPGQHREVDLRSRDASRYLRVEQRQAVQ